MGTPNLALIAHSHSHVGHQRCVDTSLEFVKWNMPQKLNAAIPGVEVCAPKRCSLNQFTTCAGQTSDFGKTLRDPAARQSHPFPGLGGSGSCKAAANATWPGVGMDSRRLGPTKA